MLVIRLTRVGKRNSPAYRVVVADKRRAVKRKFIEILGHYNPTTNPKELKIDKDSSLFWIKNGAQPSDTVRNLMCNLGVLDKKDKINKVYGKKLSKKAMKEGAVNDAKKSKEEPEEVNADNIEKEATPETESSASNETDQEQVEEIEEIKNAEKPETVSDTDEKPEEVKETEKLEPKSVIETDQEPIVETEETEKEVKTTVEKKQIKDIKSK